MVKQQGNGLYCMVPDTCDKKVIKPNRKLYKDV